MSPGNLLKENLILTMKDHRNELESLVSLVLL